MYNAQFYILKMKIKDLVNIVICIFVTYVIYLMIFTNESLPAWTELALTLGYPTLMAVMALQSNNGEQEVWTCYFILYALVILIEVILTTFLPQYIKYITIGKLPFLLFCLHPLTDDMCKFFVKNVLGILCAIIKLEQKVFN